MHVPLFFNFNHTNIDSCFLFCVFNIMFMGTSWVLSFFFSFFTLGFFYIIIVLMYACFFFLGAIDFFVLFFMA